jgi:hypothetical protein
MLQWTLWWCGGKGMRKARKRGEGVPRTVIRSPQNQLQGTNE